MISSNQQQKNDLKIHFGDYIYLTINQTLLSVSDYLRSIPKAININSIKYYKSCIFQVYSADIPYLDPPQSSTSSQESFLDLNVISKKQNSQPIPLEIGTPFHLLHVETQKFLTVNNVLDNDFSKLILQDHISEENSFIIKLKPNSDDQNLSYNSKVFLISEKTGRYMTRNLKPSFENKDVLDPRVNPLTKSSDIFPKLIYRRNNILSSSDGIYFEIGTKSGNPEASDEITISRCCGIDLLQEARTNEYILTGDHIRLGGNDDFHLTCYLTKELDENNNGYHAIYYEKNPIEDAQYYLTGTLFEILKLKEKADEIDPIIELVKSNKDNDAKAQDLYLLRHSISGRYLVLDMHKNPKLCCFEEIFDSNNNDIGGCFVQFIRVEDGHKESSISVIKHNQSKFNLVFVDKSGDYHYFLRKHISAPIQNVQFELNTLFFFGYNLPELYVHKCLQAKEMFRMRGLAAKEEVYEFKAQKINEKERLSILEAESYADNLLDYLYYIGVKLADAKTKDDIINTIDQLNKKTRKIIEITRYYLKNFSYLITINKKKPLDKYNYIHSEEAQLKLPISLKMHLIREMRIYDMIHRIYFYFIRDNFVSHNLKEMKENLIKQNINNNEQNKFPEFNIFQLLVLLLELSELLLISAKNNPPNHFYNSQFIRVYINCLIHNKHGLFSINDTKLQMDLKACILKILKEFLWSWDLDGVGQLNYYEEQIFDAISQQTSFHPYYLELMLHISLNKAPNLINAIQEKFIEKYVIDDEKFKKIFPIFAIIDVPIVILRRPKGDVEKILKLSELTELQADTQNKIIFEYICSCLRLLFALVTCNSLRFGQAILKQYPYNILKRIVQDDSVNIQLRILIKLLINEVHLDYGGFTSFMGIEECPKAIFTSDEKIKAQITKTFKNWNLSENLLGNLEKQHIVEKGLTEELDLLWKLGKEEIMESFALVKQIKESKTFSIENARIAKEFIGIYLHKTSMVTPEELKISYDILVQFIEKCLEITDQKVNYFILECLELLSVFKDMVQSMIAGNIMCNLGEINANLTEKELIVALLPIEERREFHEKKLIPLVLNLLSKKEPVLSSQIIELLAKVVSYDESITDKLKDIFLITCLEEAEMVTKLIKANSRIVHWVRTQKYHREVGSPIKDEDLNNFLNELIANLDILLLILYNTENHFKYNDFHDNSNERFLRCIRDYKKSAYEKPFKLQTEAVNKKYQRLFNSLGIYKTLLDALAEALKLRENILAGSHNSQLLTYSIRTIVILMIIYLHNNKKNKDKVYLFKPFVINYYYQPFINQSCDTLLLFNELMEDNRQLLTLPYKYLQDITWYTFIGTVTKREICNNETNSYLCSSIMSLKYLSEANLPKDTFHPQKIFQDKFNNICNNNFETWSLLSNLKDLDQYPSYKLYESPHCYYSIRELLVTSIKHLNALVKKKKVHSIQNWIKPNQWLQMLSNNKFYEYQFEIRNLMLQFITQHYYPSYSSSSSTSLSALLICNNDIKNMNDMHIEEPQQQQQQNNNQYIIQNKNKTNEQNHQKYNNQQQYDDHFQQHNKEYNIKFSEDERDRKNLVEFLIYELEYYLMAYEYFNPESKINNNNNTYIVLKDITDINNPIDNEMKTRLKIRYENLINHADFHKIRQLVYFEHISITNLWTEYIYNGILCLFIKILKYEPDVLTNRILLTDKTYLEIFLDIMKQIIKIIPWKFMPIIEQLIQVMDKLYDSIAFYYNYSSMIKSCINLLSSTIIEFKQKNNMMMQENKIMKDKLPIIKTNLKYIKSYIQDDHSQTITNNLYFLARTMLHLSDETQHLVKVQLINSALQTSPALDPKSIALIFRMFRSILECQVQDEISKPISYYMWNKLSKSQLNQALDTAKDLDKLGLGITLSKLLYNSAKKCIFQEGYALLIALYYRDLKSRIKFHELLRLYNDNFKYEYEGLSQKVEPIIIKIILESVKIAFKSDNVGQSLLDYLIRSIELFSDEIITQANTNYDDKGSNEETRNKLMIISDAITNGKFFDAIFSEFGPIRLRHKQLKLLYEPNEKDSNVQLIIKNTFKKALSDIMNDDLFEKVEKVLFEDKKGGWQNRIKETLVGYIIANHSMEDFFE